MDSRKLLLSLFSLFIFSLPSVQGSVRHHEVRKISRPTRLFVFGDSYVDTGNIQASTSRSRELPYGITFPGNPSGRFSDGRVLTDYTASYLRVNPPVPSSMWRNFALRKWRWPRGINFAYGGTGVFNTSAPFPNMTTQIDLFQKLIVDSAIRPTEAIQVTSVALVSVSGNDYSFYQATTGGSAEGFKPFVISVVNQMIVNLKRISSLGVNKVIVTGLGPLGCLPQITASSSFTQCDAALNSVVQFHNLLLKQAVDKLNDETKNSTFIILDVYGAFSSFIQNKGNDEGGMSFETPLKPCCFGVSSKFSCGSVDEKGDKQYTVCENPESAFFWDSVHPSQEGWFAAFYSLRSDLDQLFQKHHLP